MTNKIGGYGNRPVHNGTDKSVSRERDAGARQRDIIAEQIDVSSLAAEVSLHIDHDKGGVTGFQRAVPRPSAPVTRSASGRKVAISHRRCPRRLPFRPLQHECGR